MTTTPDFLTKDLEPQLSSAAVEKQQEVLEGWLERHFWRNFLALWWIGNINNFHYCLVLSSSNNIATSYHLKSLVALISWANVVGGIVVRVWNAFFCQYMSYMTRVTLTAVQTLIGLFLVCIAAGLSKNDNSRTTPNSRDIALFVVVLIGVLNVGNGSSFGESVILGYIERFPSKYITGWSSGTGISGVAATIFYLIFQALSVPDSVTYGVSSIFVAAYVCLFFFGLSVPVIEGDTIKSSNNWTVLPWTKDPHLGCTKAEHRERSLKTSGSIFTRLSVWWNTPKMCEFRFLHNVSFFDNASLAAVYFLEYSVQFMAPFCFPCYGHDAKANKATNFILKESFVITQLCYQMGVLISRSSTLCFRIRRVWITTLLQSINFVIWWTQAKVKYIAPKGHSATAKNNDANQLLPYYMILFVLMFYVGLLGGANYVNVFYNILDISKTKEFHEGANAAKERGVLPPRDALEEVEDGDLSDDSDLEAKQAVRRQCCMNIGALYATAGITLGCIADVFFATFALSKADGCQ